MSNILDKIKKAGLVGRGGAGFPTALKWEAVYKAVTHDKHVNCEIIDQKKIVCKINKMAGPDTIKNCYVVCNCAEGEPGVSKDGYIVANFIERVVEGMKLAIEYLGAEKGYLYIKHYYYEENKNRILKAIKNNGLTDKLKIFLKPIEVGYIGGEETAVLNVIEGNKAEPRLRPPYPTTSGLWERPTLVNNVETFYNVSLVAHDEYKGERFYTFNGQVKHKGVFKLAADLTIEEALKATNNYPNFSFFVQVGGDASGEILNQKQLNKIATGAASITVYDLAKHNPEKLFLSWLRFFKDNSCGQCTPCREGTRNLVDIIKTKPINWKVFMAVIEDLAVSSFCALGGSVPIPIKSYLANIKDIRNK
ncbi:MAG: hypothetical protein MUF50_03235 [Planctomycetes bacterium]|jgi:NADH:ubiquinone oxidoreductase subunit F (NADH-binding)|nr:hypothetical protein [Planctomycetota bacterium]